MKSRSTEGLVLAIVLLSIGKIVTGSTNAITTLSPCLLQVSPSNTSTRASSLNVSGDDIASEQADQNFNVKTFLRDEAQARLLDAVAADDAMAVRNELALGADPRVADEHGITALHIAAGLGSLEAAHVLLEEASEGSRALASVIMPASGLSLLDLSFDETVRRFELLSAKDSEGYTPLHLAASGGFFDLMDLFLSYAAEIDLVNTSGFTPLHLAALRGDEAIVARLLSRGADPTTRTRAGLTPADLTKNPGVQRRLNDSIARLERSPAWKAVHSVTENMLEAWRKSDTVALRGLMAPDTPGLYDMQLEESPAFNSTIDRISVRGFEAQVEGHLYAPSLDPPFQYERFVVSLSDIGDDWRITHIEFQSGKGAQP